MDQNKKFGLEKDPESYRLPRNLESKPEGKRPAKPLFAQLGSRFRMEIVVFLGIVLISVITYLSLEQSKKDCASIKAQSEKSLLLKKSAAEIDRQVGVKENLSVRAFGSSGAVEAFLMERFGSVEECKKHVFIFYSYDKTAGAENYFVFFHEKGAKDVKQSK